MSTLKLNDFKRSVAHAMKTLGQGRPAEARDGSRDLSGHRSEAAVRERLYGKRSAGR